MNIPLYYLTLKHYISITLLGLIFTFNFDMRMLSMAEICVRYGCMVILLAQVRSPLDWFDWTDE